MCTSTLLVPARHVVTCGRPLSLTRSDGQLLHRDVDVHATRPGLDPDAHAACAFEMRIDPLNRRDGAKIVGAGVWLDPPHDLGGRDPRLAAVHQAGDMQHIARH
jgi:hypothetical protein